MVHIGLLLGAILVASVSLSGTAAAQERQLGSDGDVKLSIPSQYRCGTTAPVTVTAPDPSLFTQDQVRLQRLLGLIRVALGFECPTVSTIEVSGVVGGRQVYSGTASAADGWRLATTQDARSQPVRTERELVRDLQRQLNALGYDAGPDDGLMGPRVRRALNAFQRDTGLSASATPDAQTMAALSQAMQARNLSLATADPTISLSGPDQVRAMNDRASVGSGMLPQSDPRPDVQSTAANFETAPEPSHDSLLSLYMAANADILDTEAFAWEHYLVRHITPGSRNRPSPECHKLLSALDNPFERDRLMEQARALLRPALAEAAAAPKTRVFKMRSEVRLSEYDQAKGSFAYSTVGIPYMFGGTARIARDTLSLRSSSAPRYYRSDSIKDHCRRDFLALGTGRSLPGSGVIPQYGRHPSFSFDITPDSRLLELPLSAEAAQALLASMPSAGGYRSRNSVMFETLIEVGPATFNANSPGIPSRVIAARALHPTTGQVVYAYDLTPQHGDELEILASVPDRVTHLPMTNVRLSLLALNDRSDLFDEATLLPLVEQQISREQFCFAAIDKIASDQRQHQHLRLNPNLPMITPSWQSMTQDRDHPDRQALLDVFLSQESDWSIVTRAQGYDARFRHIVDAFIFDPEVIRGRDPRFLARELVPVLRSHLDAAQVEAATQARLQAVFPLPAVAYDFENNALRIKGSGPDSFASRANLLPPADSLLQATVEGFPYDPLAQGYRQPAVEPQQSGYRYSCSGSGPTHQWRNQLTNLASGAFRSALVFQEDLGLSGIPMETAKAEQLLSQLRQGGVGLSARVLFHVERVEWLDGDRIPTALFRSALERVEVLAPDGQVLVQLTPADFRTAEDIAAATAERDAPRVPALESVPTQPVPDAETLDLLTVRLVPDAVTDAMLERMILARWEYENQMRRANVSRTWGDFFLRQGDQGLVLLDRPDRAQRSELLPVFRQWTLERAATLPNELTLRFAVTNLKPGIVGLPSSISVDRLNLINSDVASCRRSVTTHTAMGNQLAAARQARECDRMDAARSIPQSTIEYSNPFTPGGIGPRSVCGSAVPGQDHYCAGTTAALKEVGGGDARLIDIFALDRLVEIGDADVASASAGVIELNTRVEGVSLADELPPTAWDQLTGHTRELPEGASEAHLWSVVVLSARLVDRNSGATIRDLALVEPPSLPDGTVENGGTGETAIPPTMPTGGPDVLGIHLGMSFDEADRIIRDHMEVGRELFADRARDVSVATGNIRPFTSGRLYVSTDSRELIVLYDEPPAAEGVVVGVARQVLLPKGQASPLAVFGSLRNKYGPEDLIRSGMMASDLLVWGDRRVFNEQNTLQTCLPIMGRHQRERSMWVDSEAKAPDWRNDQALENGAFPGLDSTRYGEGAGAGEYMKDCPRGVAALFQPGAERAVWDSLQVWLFDPQAYAPLIRESVRLLESSSSGGGDDADTSIDLNL